MDSSQSNLVRIAACTAAQAGSTVASGERRSGSLTTSSNPSDQGCLPGMVLPYGSRCAIACDIANYLTMGDSFHKYWTCELFDPGREAVLRPPELTCSPWDDHACLVPDPLGYGVHNGQVAGGVSGCLPGAMLLHQEPCCCTRRILGGVY